VHGRSLASRQCWLKKANERGVRTSANRSGKFRKVEDLSTWGGRSVKAGNIERPREVGRKAGDAQRSRCTNKRDVLSHVSCRQRGSGIFSANLVTQVRRLGGDQSLATLSVSEKRNAADRFAGSATQRTLSRSNSIGVRMEGARPTSTDVTKWLNKRVEKNPP
jgi:hypothetical protein